MRTVPALRSLILGSLTLLLALAAPAQAQMSSVNRQLNAIVSGLADDGYTESHLRRTGQLNDDRTRSYTIRLQEGMRYSIAGVCDDDCADLDLMLYDARGRMIDQDESTDDHPVVSVTAPRSGTFSVRVRMYDCSANPCAFGLVVFGE